MPAFAEEHLEEVVVFARGERLLGVADAASEGAVDDVPLNLRTHGHGQGYLDVNGLIPEAVERIDYRKGTYRADTGDFSMAGSSYMTTARSVQPFVAAEAGAYGWQRAAAGSSVDVGRGTLTGMAQWKAYEGPWELSEDLKHQSAWAKYSLPIDAGQLEFSASGYHAQWRPTEQIPERAIGTAVCEDVYCSLDSSATGETLRWIASARILAEDWRATLYAQYYDWHMLSNSTYDFQINQFDRRWIAGGRYERELRLGDSVAMTAGVEARYDDIGNVGVQHTEEGQVVEQISRHSVRESSLGVYSELACTPIDRLRLMGGLRADAFEFDVTARMPGVDEGDERDAVVSPKLGAAYRIDPQVELYANWGRGFHSNDARGVVNAISPVPGLSQGEGYEAGVRWERGSLRLTGTYWWLNLDSELKFVGDSNSVEPGAASKRRGYELVAFWRPLPLIGIDAVWTGSRACYVDRPDGNYVAGAVENAGELGVSIIDGRWEASVRVRYLGEYPLLEDNSQRADPETTVNVRGAWKASSWTIYAELLNIFDEHGKDIVYWYSTNVAGLDPVGEQIDGRVSRAEEPRTARVGVKYRF